MTISYLPYYVKGDPDGDTMLQLVLAYIEMYCKVTPAVILGGSRTAKHATARWLAMWLMRKHYNWTMGDIGIALNRDHSTISHGLTSFRKLLMNDDQHDYWSTKVFQFKPYIKLQGAWAVDMEGMAGRDM